MGQKLFLRSLGSKAYQGMGNLAFHFLVFGLGWLSFFI
jgi:hypothetical protein